MREFYYRHRHRIDRWLFFGLILLFVYAFFNFLFVYIAPFVIALVIALCMNPLINLLVRHCRFNRRIASLVSIIVFLAAMSSIGMWIVSTFVSQAQSFIASAPQHVEEMTTRIQNANEWLARASETLPEGWTIPDIEEMLLNAATGLLDMGMAEQGLRWAANIPDFLINLLITLVSTYFFMADREKIFNFMQNACPTWVKTQWSMTKAGLKRAMAGYFKAQAVLMAIVGFISMVGLIIIGNQYAFVLGLVFAVLDFIPMLGPALILLPWAIISFITGDVHIGVGLLIIYSVITIVRQIVQPKILGDRMGVHPLASIMAMFIGFRIFGILGFVIGPTLLIVYIGIKEENKPIPETPEYNPASTDVAVEEEQEEICTTQRNTRKK